MVRKEKRNGSELESRKLAVGMIIRRGMQKNIVGEKEEKGQKEKGE